MHSFDFISEAPQNYIFQKDANKTNLGGVLFILYLILIMGISLDYLYDYYNNDKYRIESTNEIKPLTKNERDQLLEKEELNPIIICKIDLKNSSGANLSENFEVRNNSNLSQIFYRNTLFKIKVSDFNLAIVYKCQDENCTKNMEDEASFYYMSFSYQGFKIDHQNEFEPIQKEEKTKEGIMIKVFSTGYLFFFNVTSLRLFNWENIHYKESERIFSKNEKEIIAGYIKSSEFYNTDYSRNEQIEDNKKLKILSIIQMYNGLDKYLLYKRTRVEILNVLANIASLAMSLYGGLVTCFSFLYSKNFDTYKIIDNIISRKHIQINLNKNNKKSKEIELINEINTSLLNKPSTENNLIINDINDDQENNINNNKEDHKENYCETKSITTLPKLHFWDFFINTFNYNYIIKSNKQYLISSCNDLLSKYFSVDYIIYNQIKLENLLKDYNWNNPKFKEIDNNENIKNIKNYI